MILRILAGLALAAATSHVIAQDLDCVDLDQVPPAGNVRFDQDVLPILEDDLLECTTCHDGSIVGMPLDQGEASHAALFCADTRSSRPTSPGQRIVPGAPMQSWFYLRLACDDPQDPDFRMPRNQWTLTSGELRIIHDWILQGAPSAETVFASRFDNRGYCP